MGVFFGGILRISRPKPVSTPVSDMTVSNKLSDTALRDLRATRKPRKLFDGEGLYLLIPAAIGPRTNHTKPRAYWRLKYRFGNQEKVLALGVYPDLALKKARERKIEARRLIAEGTDPGAARKLDKATRKAAATNTFEAIAREWFSKKSRKWAESNASVIMGRLEKDAFPYIGNSPIRELTSPKLLEVLRRVEDRGAVESAHRLRQYINSTFRYAMQAYGLPANPTPHSEVLATPKQGRYASITDPRLVGALMRSINGYQGTFVVRCALRLAPLVFVRPGELRTAEWSEFDLDEGEWRIPAAKMKMRAPHFVPLSRQAIEILRELHQLTGKGRYVFPSERGRSRPMSSNTINAALRGLGYSKTQMTGHGFRHMASTLLNESSKWKGDAIERQLAHAEQDSVRAVYNAAEYLPERKRMMQWWADRLDALAAANNVVHLKGHA